MLYDFHRQQNAKKTGSIHATYLLSGTKRKEDPVATNGDAKKDGEDDVMQSSPFMSSSMPQPEEINTGETSVLSVTLVREEDLEGMANPKESELNIDYLLQKYGHSTNTFHRYIFTVWVRIH